jgi:hypothetical protein
LITRGQSFSIRIISVWIAAVSTVSLPELLFGTAAGFVSAAGWQPLKMNSENNKQRPAKKPFRFIVSTPLLGDA